MKKLTFFFLFLAFLATGNAQQDKAKMERERAEIQQQLKEIQTAYNKVKGQKKQSIGQLNLLQKKMAVQVRYLNNINREIRMLNDDIYLTNLEITRLKRELDTLKAQYQKSVVYAYKNRSSYDFLNFVFSADNFNDALKRVTYLKSYRSYRQQQVASIIEKQKDIEERRQQLIGKQNQKRTALQTQTKEVDVLEEQKKETNAVVSKLKSQESELQKQINAKKKQDAQLKKQINIIIQREIAARKKAEAEEAARLRKLRDAEAAKNNTNTATTGAATPAAPKKEAAPRRTDASIPLNAKEVELSNSFAGNKGKLPWPVDNGFVSIHYGTYEIPGTRIKGDNPGITISTPAAGTAVKAVFDGEVLGVFNLGDGMAVTISHGKYFTTYSNLSSVSVSKGSNVRTGQAIGRAAVDDEDGSGGKIDFILMVGTDNVNPEPWLRRN